MKEQYHPGLENVVACETTISFLDVEHEEIVIRGYDLIELARKRDYLDVAYLILNGNLPTLQERSALETEMRGNSNLPEEVYEVLKLLPTQTHPMDALRTGISLTSGYDAELENRSSDANYRKAIRLLAIIPQIVANSHHLKTSVDPIRPLSWLHYSANFLHMITANIPSDQEARIFDQVLIAYSEHEMPNSTFTARVIASTQADLYCALTGAVASLKGSLHGGANEAVMQMLLEAGSADRMETYMLAKLEQKERIMGFGHRVYMKKMDPRAQLMKVATAELAKSKGQEELYEMCLIGERVMLREKNLYPNLDYYAAPVLHMLGILIDLFTPVFLTARSVGLCAHVSEQHNHNRLFRPRVKYTGLRDLHVEERKEFSL